MDELELLLKMAQGKEYKAALRKIESIKQKIKEINAFRLDSVLEEAEQYFQDMRSKSPKLYEMLKISRKEITELVIAKRTGVQMVIN
jgi:K+/H+ antiporter YhaU regulatory subunit KhtT